MDPFKYSKPFYYCDGSGSLQTGAMKHSWDSVAVPVHRLLRKEPGNIMPSKLILSRIYIQRYLNNSVKVETLNLLHIITFPVCLLQWATQRGQTQKISLQKHLHHLHICRRTVPVTSSGIKWPGVRLPRCQRGFSAMGGPMVADVAVLLLLLLLLQPSGGRSEPQGDGVGEGDGSVTDLSPNTEEAVSSS